MGIDPITGLDDSITPNVEYIEEATDGICMGRAATSKVGFHGASPVVQRSGAAQAAVVTTSSTQTSPFGYSTQAQADSVVTLLNEIRAALVEKGIIAGQ